MIKYSLICRSLNCNNKENFDAWFQNIDAFEYQKSKGLVSCPICGSDNIIKSLTTPSLRMAKTNILKKHEYEKNIDKNSSPTISDAVYNNKLTAVLRSIKKEIQKNSENVGNNFVKEARKMKEGKIEEKSIYGNGSKVEIEELKDEGIDVINIPWVPDDH